MSDHYHFVYIGYCLGPMGSFSHFNLMTFILMLIIFAKDKSPSFLYMNEPEYRTQAQIPYFILVICTSSQTQIIFSGIFKQNRFLSELEKVAGKGE